MFRFRLYNEPFMRRWHMRRLPVVAVVLWAGMAWASGGPILDGSVPAPSEVLVLDSDAAAGWVMLQWSPVLDATSYRIWRRIRVSAGIDSSGTLVQLDQPKDEYVPWAKVDPVPDTGGEMRARISTLDNVVTQWAVSTVSLRDGVEQMSVMQPAVYAATAVGQVTWGALKSMQRE